MDADFTIPAFSDALALIEFYSDICCHPNIDGSAGRSAIVRSDQICQPVFKNTSHISP
jgi:hypothetical protein